MEKDTLEMNLQLSLFDFFAPLVGRKRKSAEAQPRLQSPLRQPTAVGAPQRRQRPERRRRQRPASDPALKLRWVALRRQWFPHREDLDNYTLLWSGRGQLRTLASCNIYLQRVTVARELNYEECSAWLDPLLYHEMCHAYLGDTVSRWHGKEFKALERRNPQIKNLDRWIKDGGWARAVRSDRSKRAFRRRSA